MGSPQKKSASIACNSLNRLHAKSRPAQRTGLAFCRPQAPLGDLYRVGAVIVQIVKKAPVWG